MLFAHLITLNISAVEYEGNKAAVSTPDVTDILADDRGAQDIFQKHTGWHWDGRPGRETGAADGVSQQQLSSQLRPAAALQVPVWAPLLPGVSKLDMQQTQEGI